MVGDSCTIVDMAVWGWARVVPFIFGEHGWGKLSNLTRLFDESDARPPAARASALKDKHVFKAEMDADARRHMLAQIKAA